MIHNIIGIYKQCNIVQRQHRVTTVRTKLFYDKICNFGTRYWTCGIIMLPRHATLCLLIALACYRCDRWRARQWIFDGDSPCLQWNFILMNWTKINPTILSTWVEPFRFSPSLSHFNIFHPSQFFFLVPSIWFCLYLLGSKLFHSLATPLQIALTKLFVLSLQLFWKKSAWKWMKIKRPLIERILIRSKREIFWHYRSENFPFLFYSVCKSSRRCSEVFLGISQTFKIAARYFSIWKFFQITKSLGFPRN